MSRIFHAVKQEKFIHEISVEISTAVLYLYRNSNTFVLSRIVLSFLVFFRWKTFYKSFQSFAILNWMFRSTLGQLEIKLNYQPAQNFI